MSTTRIWILVLSIFSVPIFAASVYAQGARQRIVNANSFPGVDIGAKINAAGKSLGAGPGEIQISGGGRFDTQAVISPGHTLRLKGGVYKSTVPGPSVLLSDNTALVADSWDSVLEESTATNDSNGLNNRTGQSVFTIVQGRAGALRNGDLSMNIRIEGVHFRGARSDFNSTHQTVSLGNCHNCVASRNWLENTRTIGIQAGGGAMYGHSAKNVRINDNLFTGVASQNLAFTNVVGAEASRNRFQRMGQVGGPGVSVIDVEPNTDDSIDDLLISDNIIEAEESAADAGGPKATNGIVVNNGNPTKIFARVRVERNTILGYNKHKAGGGGIIFAAILLRTAKGTIVSSNKVHRVTRGILVDYQSTGNVIENNLLEDCGSGSTGAIMLEDSSGNTVRGNTLRSTPDNIYPLGDRGRLILVSGRSTNNRIENNPNALRN